MRAAVINQLPGINMDSGFLVNASSGVLGKEDWTLAVGGGRARGTGSSGSCSSSM